MWHVGYSLNIGNVEIKKCFLKIQGVISRTAGSILGLFVLIRILFHADSKYDNENLNLILNLILF